MAHNEYQRLMSPSSKQDNMNITCNLRKEGTCVALLYLIFLNNLIIKNKIKIKKLLCLAHLHLTNFNLKWLVQDEFKLTKNCPCFFKKNSNYTSYEFLC